MRRRAALGGALALLLVPAASAHVTLSPAFVGEGATSAVSVVTPNERPGHTTVRVTVEVPEAVEIVGAQAPPGWVVERTGRTAVWSGGRIADDETVELPLELHGVGPAGAVELSARQRYEDGAEVTWRAALTVLPASGEAAPSSHVGRALVAALAGVALVAGSLLVLHRLRKRPLQDG